MKISLLASSLFLTAVSAQTFSGTGTFYEPNGLFGSCGETIQDDDFAVALSSEQYTSADCFRTIQITSGGISTQAVIKDECFTCIGNNGMDMTAGLFQVFAPLQDGLIPITWEFV
ncbi:expansin family protein [Pholiota molesta]|nr:expansin family protein [Pholiota molesta]